MEVLTVILVEAAVALLVILAIEVGTFLYEEIAWRWA